MNQTATWVQLVFGGQPNGWGVALQEEVVVGAAIGLVVVLTLLTVQRCVSNCVPKMRSTFGVTARWGAPENALAAEHKKDEGAETVLAESDNGGYRSDSDTSDQGEGERVTAAAQQRSRNCGVV